MSADDPIAINRALWDSLAAVHGEGHDNYYNVKGLLAGDSFLTDAEQAAVGDVAGQDVVHIQCHIGFPSISLARAGARVTGVDLSPASLAKAANLAERCGVDIDFVEANSMDLPPSLDGRFDLAFASYGVITWISDMAAWMRCAARTLRPGGRLVLVELHPVSLMFESLDPVELRWSYAYDGPTYDDSDGSYADRDAKLESSRSVEFQHCVGEVATAAARAGLHIDELTEHLDAQIDPMSIMTKEADGRFRYRINGYPMPTLFTLTATKPR